MTYVIDVENVIIGMSGDMRRFSIENGGLPDIVERVIGTKLWEHIDDPETCSYLNAIFFSVRRLQRPIDLKYRCDSPDVPRQFQMTIDPSQDNSLALTHRELPLIVPVARDAILEFGEAYHAPQCSICCRYNVSDTWVDPFHHPGSQFSPSSHRVCASCKSLAVTALKNANSEKLALQR